MKYLPSYIFKRMLYSTIFTIALVLIIQLVSYAIYSRNSLMNLILYDIEHTIHNRSKHHHITWICFDESRAVSKFGHTIDNFNKQEKAIISKWAEQNGVNLYFSESKIPKVYISKVENGKPTYANGYVIFINIKENNIFSRYTYHPYFWPEPCGLSYQGKAIWVLWKWVPISSSRLYLNGTPRPSKILIALESIFT